MKAITPKGRRGAKDSEAGDKEALRKARRDFAEAQRRLAKIASIAPAAVHEFRLAADGKMTMPFSTEAIRDIYGFPPEELAKDFSIGQALIHPDDLPRIGAAVEESRRSLTPFRQEWRVLHPQRGEIWIECRSTPESQADGAVVWYGYLHDITERKRAEERLRNSEERYRALYHDIPVMIFTLNTKGDVVAVNPSGVQQLGYPEEELVGKSVLKVFYPDDRPAVTHQLGVCLANPGQLHHWQFRKVRKDGEILWVEEIAQLVKDLSGATNVLVVCQDITERKRTAEMLEHREQEFRMLAENSPDIIIRYDCKGRRRYVNPAYEQEFGVSADDAVNKGLREHWMLDTPVEQYEAKLRHVLETGEPANVELISHRSDGRVVTQEVRLVPEWHPGGGISGALAIGRNITALKEAIAEHQRTAEMLQRREQEFRTLAENSPDIIIRYDRECRRIYVNPAYVRDFGYSASEFLNKRPNEDWKLDTPVERYMECIRRAVESGVASNIELTSRRPDGRRSIYEVRIVPERQANGEIVGALALGRNITALKETEAEIRRLNAELEQRVEARTRELAAERAKLEAANKELEAFSYSVSHDLRAPLRSIDGFSRILLEDFADKLGDEGMRSLETVRAASQRMAGLIDDMLQLSRVTRSEMRLAPVDLSALAREVVAGLREVDPERNVEVEVAPRLTASADGHLVRIVLENLVGNAWKFTSRQEVARIEIGQTDTPDGPAFFVRDNGVGFDMAYVHKLFGAFQRLHTTAEFPGTGIGLATVQRVIRRHGGRVWAEGKPDCGATFFFTLPGEANL
jgi:PAS domain S-box-containing protein